MADGWKRTGCVWPCPPMRVWDYCARSMEGFGFVTPWVEKRTVLACTFVQRKFAGRAPDGHVLLRAFLGGALQADLLILDDNELQKRVLADLNDLLGIPSPPLFSVIERWKRAM